MRCLTILISLLLAVNLGATNHIETTLLQRMAQAIHLQLPSLEPATNRTDIATYQGRPLRIMTNTLGDVSHIGYQLFADDVLQAHDYASAFRFIERYLLQLDLRLDGKSPSQRMDIDDVVLTKGTFALLKQVGPSTPFSVKKIKRRLYGITWTCRGKTVSITFPATGQLLRGCNAIELEKNLLRDVPRQSQAIPQLTDELLQGFRWSKADQTWVADDGYYVNTHIVRRLYLQEVDGKRVLIQDAHQATSTITNRILTGISPQPLPTTLVIDEYGYKKSPMNITWAQWIAQCQAEGCKLYVGVKSVDTQKLRGTLFALNNDEAYVHVVAFEFPIALLRCETSPIQARLYAYIPLQNVAEKFFKENLKTNDNYEN